MKNKKFNILIMMLFATTIIFLTACGSTNKLVTTLNEVMDKTVESWKEKGNLNSVTISGIQEGLSKKNQSYVIIASGDKEFKKSAISKIYTTEVEEYDGYTFGVIRPMEKDSDVNYVMIYDTDENKYYNIEIEYKSVSINGANKYYPYFKNASVIE